MIRRILHSVRSLLTLPDRIRSELRELRLAILAVERSVDRMSKRHTHEVAALRKQIKALRNEAAAPARAESAGSARVEAERVSCPACDSYDVHVIDSWPMQVKRQAVACDQCGLLFVHPQPTPSALAAHYARDGSYRAKQPVKPSMMSNPAYLPLLTALDRYFDASQPAAGSRVLDYGCGSGRWLNMFQDSGWETFGIEPSTDLAFTRHHRLEAVPSDEQFDFVLIHHVLEHLGRPLDTLRDLARALKPGGYCLVCVPRLDTLDVHRDIGYCLQSRTHIVGFTQACLTGLLARAGLGLVDALHGLDDALTDGRPSSLRLLARKGATAALTEDPIAALQRVVDMLPSVASTSQT